MSSPRPPRRRRIAGERRRAGEQPELDERRPPPPPPPAAAPTATSGTTRPDDDEPTIDADRPAPRRAGGSGGRPRTAVAAVLVLLTLLGAVSLVLMFVGAPRITDFGDVREGEATRVAAESAPSVAERAAQAILAYDHRRLDADEEAAMKFMTEEFAEEYSTTFDKTVKPAARTYKARVTAEVRGSSVIRADSDRVRVLLFVDQTTRSTAHQRPQVALNRVEFDMVQQGGDWLVDGISSF